MLRTTAVGFRLVTEALAPTFPSQILPNTAGRALIRRRNLAAAGNQTVCGEVASKGPACGTGLASAGARCSIRHTLMLEGQFDG